MRTERPLGRDAEHGPDPRRQGHGHGAPEGHPGHSFPDGRPAGPRALLATVHAVDALVGIVTCGDAEASLDREFLESVGLSGRIAEWRRLVEAEAASWE